MIFTGVTSSCIAAFAYDTETSVLIIQFKQGDTYNYLDVPKCIADSLCVTKSKGTFFNKWIKKNYNYIKK